jgi:deoxyribodipyrimidine photo-lyase
MNDALSDDFFDTPAFEPTLAAAHARMAAVRPAAYAGTRNAIDGAVTRLSPYLTHGLLTVPGVLQVLLQRGRLPVQHKLVYELGWRDFFQHVWLHEGDAIFESLQPGVRPDDSYARELPADIREGRSGVPAIDTAVRTLYATGYLHNHARMWLASYIVHLRHVHWRVAADWLYGHLLDGDLASNHLSWQWVAATGSAKPYLFNADNVKRYAPSRWHSPRSVIDTDYATLERIARQGPPVAAGPASAPGVSEPALLPAPPSAFIKSPATAPDAAALRGREVFLVHPWSLGPTPEGVLRVGLIDLAFHRRHRWSAMRWQFVGARMKQACDLLWAAEPAALLAALHGAQSVRGTHNLHLDAGFKALPLQAAPRLLPWPESRSRSFSQFWLQATKGLHDAAELR